jgi:hypothetical protein
VVQLGRGAIAGALVVQLGRGAVRSSHLSMLSARERYMPHRAAGRRHRELTPCTPPAARRRNAEHGSPRSASTRRSARTLHRALSIHFEHTQEITMHAISTAFDTSLPTLDTSSPASRVASTSARWWPLATPTSARARRRAPR